MLTHRLWNLSEADDPLGRVVREALELAGEGGSQRSGARAAGHPSLGLHVDLGGKLVADVPVAMAFWTAGLEASRGHGGHVGVGVQELGSYPGDQDREDGQQGSRRPGGFPLVSLRRRLSRRRPGVAPPACAESSLPLVSIGAGSALSDSVMASHLR